MVGVDGIAICHMPYGIWHHVSYPISGAIRVLVALVRMIQDLWARASSMWLLGEFGFGILLFCSPGFWDVGGLLRALSSPGG